MKTAALKNAFKASAPDSLVLLFQMSRYPEGLFRRPADLRAA